MPWHTLKKKKCECLSVFRHLLPSRCALRLLHEGMLEAFDESHPQQADPQPQAALVPPELPLEARRGVMTRWLQAQFLSINKSKLPSIDAVLAMPPARAAHLWAEVLACGRLYRPPAADQHYCLVDASTLATPPATLMAFSRHTTEKSLRVYLNLGSSLQTGDEIPNGKGRAVTLAVIPFTVMLTGPGGEQEAEAVAPQGTMPTVLPGEAGCFRGAGAAPAGEEDTASRLQLDAEWDIRVVVGHKEFTVNSIQTNILDDRVLNERIVSFN
jgi:hypothetical protein